MKKKSILFISVVILLGNIDLLPAQEWSAITTNNIWNLNTGNVGIGTTTPARKLVVQGSDDGTPQIRVQGTADSTSYWEFGRESAVTGDFFIMNNRQGTINKRLTIKDTNGNVGIGTVTPESKLHVSGATDIEGSLVSAILGDQSNHWTYFGGTKSGRIRGSNEGFLMIGSNPNGLGDKNLYLNHDTQGNIIMALGGGNVGIGTSTINTTDKLMVNGNIKTNGQLLVSDGTTGYLGIAQNSIYSSQDLNINYWNGTTATSALTVQTGTGNIGFGTSPAWKLDLSGTGSKAGIHLYKSDAVTASWYLQPGRLETGEFSIGNDSLYALTISKKGNVGIGTTTPVAKLHVVGTTHFSGDSYFGSGLVGILSQNAAGNPSIGTNGLRPLIFNIGGNEKLRVDSLGNVGIGTTSPTQKLQVNGNIKLYGTGNKQVQIYSSNSTGSATTQYLNTTMNYEAGIFSDQNYGVNYGATRAFTINSGGNVGIGTTAPGTKLQVSTANSEYLPSTASFSLQKLEEGYGLFSGVSVSGNAWLQAGKKDNTTNYNLILQSKGGNVGIGTNNPSAKLEVTGDFLVKNGDNVFRYNGNGDVTLKYPTKGTGGRAMVHNNNNTLVLNFGNDFTGGTQIGSSILFKDGGNSYINSGKIGIGTTTPDALLTVKGTIHALEVLVDVNGALVPDFVFQPSYKLMPLNQVEQYVKTNNHLPDIPSAKEVSQKGINIAEMQNKLLQKIEELTLYVIEQQKKIEALEKK